MGEVYYITIKELKERYKLTDSSECVIRAIDILKNKAEVTEHSRTGMITINIMSL